jgi:alkylation response protein AidB-like acyl-CoA dehydrogenase
MAVERDLLDAALAVAFARPGHATAAAARAVAAACAGAVATGAHQLHGAIGVTQEYPLHRLTRRLWAWRDEDGSQRRWEETVGAEVLLGDGDDGLWSLIAGAQGAATAVPV